MALPRTFKAWTYSSVNGKLEDSLQLDDQPTPLQFLHVKQGKVLVEVLAASLNPADYKIPESSIESRVVAVKTPASPGFDFCGRVVDKTNRHVFGKLSWPGQYGSLGQYVLVNEEDIVDLPNGVDVFDAAATPTAALTAIQSLEPFVKSGDRVLVNGGSGGVGTFTIQIAKLMGCHVVATCSTKNVQLCKDLGADHVIDYTTGDIITQLRGSPPFDMFVDNVGNDTQLHKRSGIIMKTNAQFVLVSGMLGSFGGISSMAESLIRPAWLGGASSRYSIVLCKPNKSQLQQISQWLEQKRLRVIIDEVLDSDAVPKAFAKLRTGRARGKIVVRGVNYKSPSS